MVSPVPVPIDQRFAQLIQQFGLTKNSFAISLGKTASVVQHLIDGRNKPGYDLLCKVFEIYPNVSRDWLLLGRGPMLVSGEHAPKVTVPVAPEFPVDSLDMSDIEVPPIRRTGPGVAGTRLQPADIAATLALAAAATQPVRTTVPPPVEPAPDQEAPTVETSESAVVPTAPVTSVSTVNTPAAPVLPPEPTPALVEAIPTATAPSVPTPAASLTPEMYVTAALHAQHLQHQLAVAELRNQHLLEQQQMLREMLAMARQAMV